MAPGRPSVHAMKGSTTVIRHTLATLGALAVLLGAQAARADVCDNAEASFRGENEAVSYGQAGDYDDAFTTFQEFAVIRANCADETSGSESWWHTLWQATDIMGESVEAHLSDDHSDDEATQLWQNASGVLGELAQYDLPPTLYKAYKTLKSTLDAGPSW
jgi:hypothetical protein